MEQGESSVEGMTGKRGIGRVDGDRGRDGGLRRRELCKGEKKEGGRGVVT